MWNRYKDTFYEVSIDGRVRTIEHIVNKSDGTTYTCVPKELKPSTDKKGYKRGLARKYGFDRSIFRRSCINEING